MNFFLISRCTVSPYAKVEKLILLFSNLSTCIRTHLCTECISNSLSNERGPETIIGDK